MQEYLQAAFLLHSRPYKEHQLVLDLLTENDGKVSALIFSGNSIKSNKKALLQPFSPLNISFKGQGSLKKISMVEAAGKSFRFQGNYLYSGFYLNELLVRLLGELLPCPELYLQYKESLTQLSDNIDIEIILRRFEMVLLAELGQTIDFSELEYQNSDHFYYVAEHGFVPAIGKLPQPCYDKKHLLAIATNSFSQAEVRYTCKLLMRQIMAPLLGNKPLNSRKLFKKALKKTT